MHKKFILLLHCAGGNGLDVSGGLKHKAVRAGYEPIAPCGPHGRDIFRRFWYYQINRREVNEDMFAESVEFLRKVIEDRLNDSPEATISVAGFSQGGSMAMALPFVMPDISFKWSGNFCGYIPQHVEKLILDEPDRIALDTNFFISHGYNDRVNEFELDVESVDLFQRLGIPHIFSANPSGHYPYREDVNLFFSL